MREHQIRKIDQNKEKKKKKDIQNSVFSVVHEGKSKKGLKIETRFKSTVLLY